MAERPQRLRQSFTADLDQLRLQVEVMAARVEEALERMERVLLTGDETVAEVAVAADDRIDEMLVSLTERCYDLLRRENPVASDLRFVVSVLRMLEELERIGDLALRVVKLAPSQPLLTSSPTTFDILRAMADEARHLYRLASDAWSSQDLGKAQSLVEAKAMMEIHYRGLMTEILRVEGESAVAVAISTLLAGRALERIADHTVIVGERLRYMLTGDPSFLATEIR